jgi:alpha-amylase/alpha-mannosidase (GH57 family)
MQRRRVTRDEPGRRRPVDDGGVSRPDRPRLVVHGHFYQPNRADPFTGRIPRESTAAPFNDWNERINDECYRPNAERGNLDRISFDIGPTLANWLAEADPATHGRFVSADFGGSSVRRANAMAQAYHHSILPLASLRDRRTEIAWGMREFELRFGRRPTSLWLPETAVDLPTLRLMADAGLTHTVLAPWQSATSDLDTRRPYRVNLGGGRSIVIVFYDGALSSAVAFDPAATVDADQFVRRWLAPRFADPLAGAAPAAGRRRATTQDPPLVLIASDGEFYGHHQKFRDLFLQRLVGADGLAAPREFDVLNLEEAVTERAGRPFRTTTIVERSSWSCHHGVARWSAECPDAVDGRWKGPLRQAFDRLGASIDAVSERLLADAIEPDRFWAAREEYVDVLQGAEPAEAFADRWLEGRPRDLDRERFLALLEAQRWRLAMFASDGWFWEEPSRIETQQVLRAAARAVRIVDGYAGTSLERRLGDDLTLLWSPLRRVDGLALYREALSDVGQPAD